VLAPRILFRGLLLLLAVALIGPASAAAEGVPNISLKLGAPASALAGTNQEVTLSAANPLGEKRGYNLTFRSVLPKKVNYVPGSGTVEPRIIANAPAAGETTLIFENVADLSGNSEFNLTYEVEPLPAAYGIAGEYKSLAEAFVSRKPRYKPKFNAKGEVISGETSFTGSAKSEAKTKLSAIEIAKSEPSPEGELLRGLHQHQTVYTLALRNNKIGPTKELAVDDYLPAGLEFLACDEADNTVDAAGTNPGSKEEYPGSGPINAAGNVPATESCLKPSLVETVKDPTGLPAGVYTHVRWSGLGELEPGGERKIQYIAAVPIRQNTVTFPGGTPSAAGLGQAANLDNNSGPETVDEEALTNHAAVEGKYNGITKVEDSDEITRTAEDLAVQKSVKPTTISDGQISNWTLKIESSEYRYVKNVRVDDLTPNGVCPLGEENYEGPIGAPIEVKEECNAVKGTAPSAEYTSVEEREDGRFALHWDETTVPALEEMAPSSTVEIVYPTRSRVDYQEKFKDLKPVLTGDSWTNKVNIAGADYARCAPGNPTCAGGGTTIFTQETEGTDDLDESAASQQAGGVTIDKTVRENNGKLVPVNCEDGEAGEYVQGLASPLPLYGPGDKICWQLRVNFAANLYAGTPTVTDFLPPNEKYLVGSAHATGNNNVNSNFDESEAEGGSLEWTLGTSGVVENGSKVFEWRFATEMQKVAASAPEDITGNLMKFTYSNSEGKTFPLRDRAEIERQEPELKLAKGVFAVNGTAVGGDPGPHTATVHGGDKVTFHVDLKNEGNLGAEEVEVWDKLPAGIECSAIEAIKVGTTASGSCEGTKGPIVWKGVAVAKGASAEPLSYVATIPSNVAPSQVYTNKAGVTEYKTKTDTGGKFEYFPERNFDPTKVAKANTTPVEDEATVTTAEAKLAKTATPKPPLEQVGNKAAEKKATIGETVKYELKATIPAGSVVFGSPTITDPLGTRLKLIGGTAKGKVNGVEITGGSEFAVAEVAGNPVLKFPATYSNVAGSGDDIVVLEFEATVVDEAANVRATTPGSTLTNTGKLTFQDQNAVEKSKTASATVTVVEPTIAVSKGHGGSGTVKPGEIIPFTVTAENPTVTASNPTGVRVSTANDSELIDTVPAGLTPVNGTTPVGDGKTVEPDGGIWHEGSRTITWTIAELAPGATAPRHYSLRVEPSNAGAVFANTVRMTTTSLPGAVAGERGTASTNHAGYEAEATDSVKLIEAGLTKSVEAPKGTTIGDPLTYTLNLKLQPNVAYFDSTVEDHLPKGVIYDGTASITCAPGCEAVAEVGSNNPLTPGTEAGSPLLGWYFGPIASAGVERTVTIVYRAHIAGEFEPGVKILDRAQLENHAIGLYNGAPKFIAPPTTPPARGEFKNKTNEPTRQVEVLEPKLTIAKSVTGESQPGTVPPRVQPGDALTYTVTVTNSGDSPAYDALVEDAVPFQLQNIVPTEGAGFITAGSTQSTLKWIVPGPIAPNASVTLRYTAELIESKALQDEELVTNVAKLPAYFGAPEAQRKEEGLTRFREYSGEPAPLTLATALPQLRLTKVGGPGLNKEGVALIGVPYAWQLEVQNLSEVASVKGVNLLDKLPAGWEYVEGSAEIVPAGTKLAPSSEVVNAQGETELSWQNVAAELGPLGGMTPPSGVTLRYEAVPTTVLVAKPGIYTNRAIVSGEDLSGSTEGGGHLYGNEETAKANLKTPGLAIEKTPHGGAALAGETKSYQIKISNNGEAEATELEVVDTLGAGNVYTAGAAAAEAVGGGAVPGFVELPLTEVGGKTVVTWKFTKLAPSPAAVVITVPVELPSSLADGSTVENQATVSSKQQPTPTPPATGSFDITRETDLAIEKTEATTNLNAGEVQTYELHVKNLGPSDATGVVAKDKLPTNVKLLAPLPAGCAEAGATLECPVGSLALNEEVVLKTVRVQVLSGATGTVVNTAEVSSATHDPKLANNESSKMATLGGSADLSIKKTGPSAPVLLGSIFTYTLEVENHGPSDANAAEVKDALPAGVEGLTVETNTGTCVEPLGTTVECALGTMIPAAKATIHLTVKAVAIPVGGAPVVNQAEVTSPTPDPEPANDKSKAETTVLPAADLAIVKTADPTVAAGGQLTYKLHVENHGPSDATGVAVTDPLPAGTVFVSASEGCAAAGGTVICAIGELAIGEARDLQVLVTVPLSLAGTPLVNTATVAGHEADPVTTNDSSTAPTQVGPAADLEIVKTMGAARAGQSLTYTLAVTNHGPSASSAVSVHDTLPAGVAYSSSQASQGSCATAGAAVTCQLGPLASGASAQVTITVAVAADATGTLRNAASVEGPEPDPNKANNESAVEGPIGPPLASAPDLHVVKTADESHPEVGTPFHYRVTVSNRSGATAKDVRVTDTLNGPAKITKVAPDKGSCQAPDAGRTTCLIPTLAPHAVAHIVFTVVAERAGALTNEASAMAANGEVAPADNHAVKDVTAKASPATYTLTKTASRAVVPGGGEVGFTIALRNGPAALTGVVVCDRLPDGLVFVRAPGAGFVTGAACWKRPFVAAGRTLKLHLVARAVRGYKTLRVRNVAAAEAGNGPVRKAGVTVRIKPAFGGEPGGVTG
jgi:uncharacterized repeat protein (TIGR01451 family)/fimbrial isopeptide formation D2 family protein